MLYKALFYLGRILRILGEKNNRFLEKMGMAIMKGYATEEERKFFEEKS